MANTLLSDAVAKIDRLDTPLTFCIGRPSIRGHNVRFSSPVLASIDCHRRPCSGAMALVHAPSWPALSHGIAALSPHRCRVALIGLRHHLFPNAACHTILLLIGSPAMIYSFILAMGVSLDGVYVRLRCWYFLPALEPRTCSRRSRLVSR